MYLSVMSLQHTFFPIAHISFETNMILFWKKLPLIVAYKVEELVTFLTVNIKVRTLCQFKKQRLDIISYLLPKTNTLNQLFWKYLVL